MLCRNPFVKGDLVFGCGQCLACRVQRRRVWVHRMMLESLVHSASTFLTLTYRDPPVGPPRGNVDPDDVSAFLKRLRARIHPVKVRVFVLGEYGEQTLRPHYHLAVFGLGAEHEQLYADVWGKGFVKSLPWCLEAAKYLGAYVSQKLSARKPPGRVPMFTRMSRHPGLGAAAVDGAVASVLTGPVGARIVSRDRDVPGVLRHAGALMPLGRYLKDRAREAIGMEKGLPLEHLETWKDELRSVRQGAPKGLWVQALRSVDDQAYLNLEAKVKLGRRNRI